jgi:hypothetical protein
LISQYAAAFSVNSVFKPRVRVQYLLSLESPVGEVKGDGWYDAGTYANFTVRLPAVLKGFGLLLGVDFFFEHWLDEHGNRLLSGSLRMDSPHMLRAVWGARLADWRPFVALLILIVVLMLAFESKQRRLRKNSSAADDELMLGRAGAYKTRMHLSSRRW